MSKILLTGATGFLGSHLLKSLILEKHEVVILKRSFSDSTRIKSLFSEVKVYDIDLVPLELAFQENSIENVIHTATNYSRENVKSRDVINANLFMPFDLLDKAIQYGCKIFINTDTVLNRFVNSYALTKRHFQEWLYFRRNEIKIINIQLEHFYGPNAPDTNFISTMIKRLKMNEPAINLTAGEQLRDFVYIDDVVNAFKIILNCDLSNNYSEFCVATQQLNSIKHIMKLLKEFSESTTELNFGAIPYRENELMHSVSNNLPLLDLGWKPSINIKKGLEKCVNFNNNIL